MTPGLAVASKAVLSAVSTASNPELQKIDFAVSWEALDLGRGVLDAVVVHRSKVIRLSSRASLALRACGCTSPMACRSAAIWRWPAWTTRGLAWPAAATPNAAV